MKPTISPQLHTEIWRDLQTRVQPSKVRTVKAKSKAAKPKNPSTVLWSLINSGGSSNITKLEELLKQGVKPEPTHLQMALEASISMSDTCRIITLLLQYVSFPKDPLARQKVVDKLYREIIEIKENNGVDQELTVIVKQLFQAGLYPANKHWNKLLLDEERDPYEDNELSDWLIREALWQYPHLAETVLTKDRLFDVLLYELAGWDRSYQAEDLINLLDRLNTPTWRQQCQKMNKPDRQDITEMVWKVAAYMGTNPAGQIGLFQVIGKLADLGLPLPLTGYSIHLFNGVNGQVDIKNGSALLRAMFDNNENIFAFLIKNKALYDIFLQELKTHEQELVKHPIKIQYFPYLEDAKVDFNLTNQRGETIFFGFLWDTKVRIPPQLDVYLVKHVSEISTGKEPDKDLFSFKCQPGNLEPRVYIGRKAMGLQAYKTYLLKRYMETTFPSERKTQAKQKPRL